MSLGNAPITKFLLASIAGCSLFAHLTRSTARLTLSQDVLGGQVWRVVTSNLLFRDMSNAFYGCTLCYFLRILEVRYGSRKYAAMLLFLGSVASVFELTLGFMMSPPRNEVPSILMGMVLAYFFDVRPEKYYGPISDKLAVYLFLCKLYAMPLYVRGSRADFQSVGAAVAAGLLYRLVGTSLRIPQPIANACDSVFGKVFGSSAQTLSAPLRQRRRMTSSMGEQYSDTLVGTPSRQRGARTVQPDETQIRQLVDMGFSRDRAVAALTSSRSVSDAAQLLATGAI